MQFEPNGVVKLIRGVPWNADYKDTRYFTSLAEQTAYFAAKDSILFTDCSYTRAAEQFVSVDANIETLWPYNYLAFQNESMGNKWFYAFVTRLEMKAASTTWVYFEIDVMQTWMFEAVPEQCFIEREHVGKQVRGRKYVVDEGLSTGWEYVTVHEERVDHVSDASDSSAIILTSTIDLSADPGSFDNPNLQGAEGGVVHHLPTGCDYYVIAPDTYGDASIYDVFRIFKDYPWVTKGIIGCTFAPMYMLSGMNINLINLAGTGYSIGHINDDSAPITKTVYNQEVFQYFDSVDQMKLLMYPYSYIEISLQTGQTLIIKPQYLSGQTLQINRTAVFSSAPEVRYWIQAYAGISNEYDFSLSMGNFPQCPVQDTSYLLSVAEKVTKIDLGIGQSVFNAIGGLVGGFMTGNVGGAISTGGNAVFDILGSLYDRTHADVQSPTLATGSGGAGFNFASGKMECVIRWKMISLEHRNILSSFFNRFGYKINETKEVHVDKMSRFDYIKTRDCHVSHGAPNDDVQKIESIYDAGITFWHDDNIGNYDNNKGVK